MDDIDFFLKLISVKSLVTTREGYEEAASLIKDKLESIGLTPTVYDGRESDEDGLPRPNVVARINLGQEKTVLLNAHYDVVPAGEGWSYDPFIPRQIGDEIHARGSSDDKCGVAAVVWAADDLGDHAKRNVVLALTCDEEVGGKAGLGYLMNKIGLSTNEALIVDGTFDDLYIGASGVDSGEIIVKGKQSHAGYPHLAKNPIYPLAKAVTRLEDFGKLREKKLSRFRSPPGSPIPYVWGRFSVTMLNAGLQSNVIPEEAKAIFDLRLLPEEDRDSAIGELREFILGIGKETQCKIDLKIHPDGGGNYYTEVENPFVQGFSKAANEVMSRRLEIAAGLGGNDGRHCSSKGIPTLVFGPASVDSRFHGIDEYVKLSNIKMVKNVILKYLKDDAL